MSHDIRFTGIKLQIIVTVDSPTILSSNQQDTNSSSTAKDKKTNHDLLSTIYNSF